MIRLRVGLCVLGGVVACGESLPKGAARWIGTEHPPLPAGLAFVVGGVVEGFAGRYGLSEIHADSARMLWLEEVSGHDSSGRARWRVIDARDVPPLHPRQSMVWRDCALDGLLDPAVIAIGTWNGTGDTLTGIVRGWRPDVAGGRIIDVSPNRISCVVHEDRN